MLVKDVVKDQIITILNALSSVDYKISIMIKSSLYKMNAYTSVSKFTDEIKFATLQGMI